MSETLSKNLYAFLALACLFVLVFLATRVIPGDPALLMAGEQASPEEIARIREQLELNRPLPVQFWHYASQAIRGDFGRSIRSQRPVIIEILSRAPATLLLTASAGILAFAAGLVLGTLGALSHESLLDAMTTMMSTVSLASPVYWLGLVFVFVFALHLRLLPSGGYGAPADLVLPAVTLAFSQVGAIARVARASVLEVLLSDHVRTAYAKGLTPARVLSYHILRNALLPILSLGVVQFSQLLGGAVITELVFSWPGLGQLMLDAVQTRDFPLVQGLVLFVGAAVIVVNAMLDASYAYLDPRVRTGARR